MAVSYAEQAPVTCPECGHEFTADIWLIVDASERPDLIERAREGTLHRVTCPQCSHTWDMDAPLLIFTPPDLGVDRPPLLFSPAQQTSAEQDREHAAALLAHLSDALGDRWRDEWLDQVQVVPRLLLAVVLADNPEAKIRRLAEEAARAVERLREEDPETYRQLEEAAREFVEQLVGAQGPAPLQEMIRILAEAGDLGRHLWEYMNAGTPENAQRILEQHPELLTDDADALLERLIETARAVGAQHAAPDENTQRLIRTLEQHRALLRRCREVGVEQAFAEIGGPPVSPEFQDDLRQAKEAEQRYLQTGDITALDEAVAAWERILNHPAFATTDERFRLAAWNDAGGAYLRRYWAKGQLSDLNRALELWQRAVAHTPEGSPDLPSILNNLALGLSDRYSRTGDLADLEQAITHWQRAVAHTPEGSPDLPGFLNNLALGLRARYSRTGDLADLEQAISHWQRAVALVLEGHPDLPSILNNLASGLSDRYSRTGDLQDLEAARARYRRASKGGLVVAPEVALTAARSWGNWALERAAWAEAVEAYGYGREAIERLLEEQVGREAKATWLKEVQGLPQRAAYAHARAGQPRQAVELLESGIARLLREALAQNSRDLERLRHTHLRVYERYRQAREEVARLQTIAPRERPLGWTEHLRRARQEVRDAVEAIRAVPGFEHFLRPLPWEEMAELARNIPLVYLLTTPGGGLALMVYRGNVTPVFLDDLEETTLRERLFGPADDPRLGGFFGAYDAWRHNHRDANATRAWFAAVDDLTRWLWDVAMGKLVHHLCEQGLDRAVLIPTGLLALLPWHAAWTEEGGEQRYALDDITLTYAPSAQVLAAARKEAANTPAARTLLAVVEPAGSGERLPNAPVVLEEMLSLFGSPPTTFPAYGPWATLNTVMKALPHYDAHLFFCHGINAWQEPLESHLALAYGKDLTVRHLLNEAPRLNARLTFLASCETGAVGMDLPDEVVGLVSGFLQAGTAAVVAPLWTVYEPSTAALTTLFFRSWEAQGLPPAQALRQAQLYMRHSDRWSHPVYWAAFALSGDGWTTPERATAAKEAVMAMEEGNGRRKAEEAAEDVERILADLPGDPDAMPVMYRCTTHGLIPPEDVNWFPDMKPHCPYCDALLHEASGGEV